jgi:hypothetical protein
MTNFEKMHTNHRIMEVVNVCPGRTNLSGLVMGFRHSFVVRR